MSRFALCVLLAGLGLPWASAAATLEVEVRDAAGKAVADAAIYALPASGPSEARGRRVEIEQVDREFVPYVSVIQTGTSIEFPNRDPILHHVYSFSPAKPFEIKLYTGKSPTEVVFDKPGVVTLGCNIHDWMIGYIVIVSTPYFGKSDASGEVRLRDLPAGTYEVRAWHPQQRAAVAGQARSIGAADGERITLVVDVAPRRAKYKPPLDRAKY